MLRHTLARTERLIPPERLLTIVSRQHLGYAREELFDRPPGTVIVQPCNRETGPGILLPLLHIYQRDPDAIVTLLPSDHFIVGEDRFVAAVEEAASFVAACSSRYLILLGVEPDRPETEYGWIEVGERFEQEWGKRLYRVKSFWEKPRLHTVKTLYHNDCRCNTLILTDKAWMLLLLFQTLTPRLYLRFQQVQPVFGGRGEAQALQELYRHLHPVNFSRAILARSIECLGVLPVKGVYWSDWGNPEQVRKDVARFAPASLHETRLSSSPS